MPALNQFQKSPQENNSVAYNILAMFSKLYDINPKYYEEYICGLTEDLSGYQVRPSFLQHHDQQGISDACITIPASQVILNTTLNGQEWVKKISEVDKFDERDERLFIHLSRNPYSSEQMETIDKTLKDKEVNLKNHIHFLTYQDLVNRLQEIADTYDFKLNVQALNKHFEEYCLEMLLLPKSNHVLRITPGGNSFDLKVKHKFHFELASRKYWGFRYLGFYHYDSVRCIGKVDNVIVANCSLENGLEILQSKHKVTHHQKTRLLNAIEDAFKKGWDINNDHRFYLLKDFHQTDFTKSIEGGILRERYFYLEDYIAEVPKNTKGIAEGLEGKFWK